MKRIMMIGAGWEQVPLIKKAKALGNWVLATNPTAEGESLAYADEACVLDPRDVSYADALFRRFDIEAIITDNCDYSLYAAGMLCWKHNLPGQNFVAISNSNNKRKSRMTCQVAGIRQPAFSICESFDDVKKAVNTVGSYSVVVKPVDNRGNFGVNIVTAPEELEDAFFDAVVNSHSRQVLVEKFIKGTLLTVEGFANGKHVSLAVSSKKMLGGKKGVAMELLYPAIVSEKVVAEAKRINDKVVKALGYDFGYTHTEYIVDEEEKIWLVESTNRGGGVYVSSIILPTITGIDLQGLLVHMACGDVVTFPQFESVTDLKCAAVLSFFQFPANGIIKSISNIDDVLRLPGVLAGRLSVRVGDRIDAISNDANRHGFIVVKAPTVAELESIVEVAKQKVRVEFEI
jgi:biotin carboxylase